ncbi:MAG: class I SAM-dependent methyltransferase [Calditrichaeota bacterium]|nr:class I SAM-dependent methyltransferase [Calditrichota bacterium]
MHEKRFDPRNWERLVSPEREAWQNVEAFLQVAQVSEREVWLDLGCGPGYFTLPLARRVAQVLAVDVSPEMRSVCQKRLSEHHIQNVNIYATDGEHLPLEDQCVDGVLMANVYHELDNPQRALAEVRRVLRPRGKLLVIDWHPVETEVGPPLDHRIPKEQVIQAITGWAFRLTQDWDIFPYHYVLEFVPRG